MMATFGLNDSTINFDGWHDNGDGQYTTATGGTTMRHNSGKGQQGDRMHNDFDRRHDGDKGQQGNRRHDDGDERAGWLDNQLMAVEDGLVRWDDGGDKLAALW
jgi:hypothetical protein